MVINPPTNVRITALFIHSGDAQRCAEWILDNSDEMEAHESAWRTAAEREARERAETEAALAKKK